MMKLLLIPSLFLFLLISLSFNTSKCRDYTYIRRQLTPDKKHYIYEYAKSDERHFWEISGIRIMSINDSFSENKGVNIGRLIEGWVSNDTLVTHACTVDYEQPKDTSPIKIKYELIDNIVIKIIYEQPTNSWGFGTKYNFDSVKIFKNRIYFLGVHTDMDNDLDPENKKTELDFPLGQITMSSEEDSIISIMVRRQDKSMDFYRVDESGKDLYHQPGIGLTDYEFIPKKKISPESMGEIGIFRDIDSGN